MDKDERLSYCTCQTSAAHTFGNVVYQIQNWLLNIFPEKTFKTVHINSKLAHRQITSVNSQFIKKSKPMIIFRPRINWDDRDVFLSNTLLTERMTDLYNSYSGTNLQEFMTDPKSRFKVKYLLNRQAMQIDVLMYFDTLIEQMNWMSFIKNAIRIDHPFFIETALESYLSPGMMNVISECCGIPVKDESGSVKDFLDYLNSHSKFPITYKMRGSTNSDEFFRYYNANIDTTITSLSADDGDRAGQIASNYSISFTIRAEFYSTGFYYIFSDKFRGHRKITVDSGETLVPIFTDVIYHEDFNLDPGWQMVSRTALKIDNPIEDSVDITPILNRSILYSIKYHIDHGMPLNMLVGIKVRRQGKLMIQNEDYTMDWKTMTLSFHRCNPSYSYSVLVCANIKYMNELIKELYNLK